MTRERVGDRLAAVERVGVASSRSTLAADRVIPPRLRIHGDSSRRTSGSRINSTWLAFGAQTRQVSRVSEPASTPTGGNSGSSITGHLVDSPRSSSEGVEKAITVPEFSQTESRHDSRRSDEATQVEKRQGCHEVRYSEPVRSTPPPRARVGSTEPRGTRRRSFRHFNPPKPGPAHRPRRAIAAATGSCPASRRWP